MTNLFFYVMFFLLALVILTSIISLISDFTSKKEGYSNYKLDQAMGNIPDAQTQVLVQDTYPPIGKNELSDESSKDMWWHYPIFTLGSYKQITNNIRYPNNPDIGICQPGSMCNALYEKKEIGNNYITPLPPVNPTCGTRVGYFTTDEQLVDSLPFRTDMQNILY